MKGVNFIKRGHFYFLGLILILWLIYFWKVFLLGYVFYLGDSFAIDLPLRIFFVEAVRNGELPLWNPYILGGIPLFLIASQGLVYPLTFLFFILSSEVAMTWVTVLNILLAGVAMYWFVFVVTKQKTAAFFAGMVYMFSGLAANTLMAIVINQELPLIPLVFLTTHLFILKRKKIFLFLTSFGLALQFISGFPLVVYLSALGITIYYWLETKEKSRQKIVNLLIISIFAFGLSAFLFLPQMELALLSTRPRLDYSYATSHSLHPFSLITFIFPHFYGIGEIEYKYNTHNRTYLGILPLLMIIWIIWRKKAVVRKSLIWLTVLGFLLAFGKYLPLYRLFLVLPSLANFREPEFFLIWYVFGGSVIAGVGINHLIQNIKKFNFGFDWRLFLLFVGLLLTVIIYLQFGLRPPLLPKLAKLKNLLLINLSNLLFSSILTTIAIIFIHKLPKTKLFVFLTLIIFADFYFLNRSEFFWMKKSEYQKIATPDRIPAVIRENADMVRIHSITYHKGPTWDNFSREEFIKHKIKIDSNVFSPNRNIFFKIASVDGFSPLVIKSYADFLTNNKQVLAGITSYDVENIADCLAKAGAKYIFANKPIAEYTLPRYKLLEVNPPYYFLYEDTQARQRAFLLDKYGKQTGVVKIVSSRANSVTLATTSEVESKLVLLDNYYPGWEAFVDGVKTEVKPFEQTFRQIDLKPGTHTVVFIFQPQSFYKGLLVTVIALLSTFIYGLYGFLSYLTKSFSCFNS